MKIRQLLGVPESLRMLEVYRPARRPRKAEVEHADSWARERADELASKGVKVELRRYRAKEPLCVVYRLA